MFTNGYVKQKFFTVMPTEQRKMENANIVYNQSEMYLVFSNLHILSENVTILTISFKKKTLLVLCFSLEEYTARDISISLSLFH